MLPPIISHSSAVHIKGLVSRGLGWAFVAMTDEIRDPSIKVIRLPEMRLERKMYLAMRANRKHGPAAERFMQFVLRYPRNNELPSFPDRRFIGSSYEKRI